VAVTARPGLDPRFRWAVGAAVAAVLAAVVVATVAFGPAWSRRGRIEVTGTVEGFDRPDAVDGLGALAGRPWVVEGGGRWGVAGGAAYLSSPAPGRSFALVDVGSPDASVSARLSTVTVGSGVAFAYTAPGRFWAVVAVPQFATWNLVEVVDGRSTVRGTTGQSAVADGTVVAVAVSGDEATVAVNGRRAVTVDGLPAQRSTRVGLTVAGPQAGEARFDEFAVALPGDEPLPGVGPP
jgi:hypothetical protein